jgi:hypothetical protein
MRYACSNAVFLAASLFPPEHRQTWFDSALREIASGHAATSRGKRNPRGVKRKMSKFPLRKRGDSLNVSCKPMPRMIVI